MAVFQGSSRSMEYPGPLEQVEKASFIDVLLDDLKRYTGNGWEQEDDV